MGIKIVDDGVYAIKLKQDEVFGAIWECRTAVDGWGWHAWAESLPPENNRRVVTKFRIVFGPDGEVPPQDRFKLYFGGLE